MRDRSIPIPRWVGLPAAIAVFCLLTASATAHADVVGRLHFSVKNAADEKPIANAKIVLKDSANTRADVSLTTDTKGSFTSAPLEARAWQVVASADTFQDDTRSVTVVADTTTEVEILLEPLKEKKIVIKANKDLVNKGQIGNGTQRDPEALKAIPSAPATRSASATSSAARPARGGLGQPGAYTRRTQRDRDQYQRLLPAERPGGTYRLHSCPETIQSLDIMTGGFAPEYAARRRRS